MYQTNLLENIEEFNNKSKTKTKEGKNKKINTFESISALYKGRELILNAFRSGTLPIKKKKRKKEND